MACNLVKFGPEDEVIIPSFTHPAVANAVLSCGATPVFADIDLETGCISASSISEAISSDTAGVIVVDYAGRNSLTSSVSIIADRYDLVVIQDSAQSIGSNDTNPLILPDYKCFSFHETKNIQCGEGGALLTNNDWRLEYVEDCGTNRASFLRGEVDKYTWVTKGSSYLIPELSATMLLGALEDLEEITSNRITARNRYSSLLGQRWHNASFSYYQSSPNGHMFYLRVKDRERLLKMFRDVDIYAVSHYEPLHLSEAGKVWAIDDISMKNIEKFAREVVRLPLYYGITKEEQEKVMEVLYEFFKS
jgi:dTDP-4-amino-4,6-dideoxygalactose transaminase